MVKDRKDKYIRLGIMGAALLLLYVALVTIVPNMSLWTTSKLFNSTQYSRRIDIGSGSHFETHFVMPFDYVNGLELFIEEEPARIIGTAEIIDEAGNVIIHKDITSPYDADYHAGFVKVNRNEIYTFRMVIDYVEEADGLNTPTVMVVSNGMHMLFTVDGRYDGAPMKWVFTVIYMFFAMLALVFLWRADKIGDMENRYIAYLVIGVIIESSILLLSQGHDLFSVSKTGFSMIEAFMHGHILDYVDYGYLKDLEEGFANRMFICDYDFFYLFPLAVLMLPVYLLYDGEPAYGSFFISVLLIAFLLIAIFAVSRLARETGLGEEYEKTVTMLFSASSVILYITVAFGQLDIMYISIIVLALIFYLRKQYRLFSLCMAITIAMKVFPLMIFVPLILLAVKKFKELFFNFVIGFSFYFVSKILFESGIGYTALKLMNSHNPENLGRVTDDKVGLFVVLFTLICVFAYFYKPDSSNKKEMMFMSMALIFSSYGAFIVFIDWHCQWMIPFVMSMCFLIPYCKDTRTMLVLNYVFEFLFIIRPNQEQISISMINLGVLPGFTNYEYSGVTIEEILSNVSGIIVDEIQYVFAAIVIAFAFFLHRNRPKSFVSSEDKPIVYPCSHALVLGRVWILYAIVTFFLWSYWYIG